jgi:hypothetical protein
MRYVLLIVMLFSMSLHAKPRHQFHKVDTKKLLEQAAKLDSYAQLSFDEMRKKTDEIHNLMHYLITTIEPHRHSSMPHDVIQKIQSHIENYKNLEQQKRIAHHAAH